MKQLFIKIVTKIWFKYYLKSDEFHHSLDIRVFHTDLEAELFITARELAHRIDDEILFNDYVNVLSKKYSYSELFILVQIMFNLRGQTIDDYLKGLKNGK